MRLPFPKLTACAAAVLLLAPAATYAAGPARASVQPPAAAVTLPAGQDKPSKPEPAPVPEVIAALKALAADYKAAFPKSTNIVQTLDGFNTVKLSEETAAQLLKVFGTERPVKVAKVGTAADGSTYQVTLQALDYTMEDKSRIVWTPMGATVRVNKAGTHSQFDGNWPSMTIWMGEEGKFALKNMSLKGTQHRSADEIWFGGADFTIEQADFGEAGNPVSLRRNTFGAQVLERGKLVDIAYQIGVGQILAGTEDAGSLKMSLTLSGLSREAVRKMDEQSGPFGGLEQSEEEDMEQALLFFRTAAKTGAALKVDDFSYSYKGEVASVKGLLRLKAGSTSGEMTDDDLLNRLSGRFSLRMPVNLVKLVARSMVAREMAAQRPGQDVSEQDLELGSQTATDVIIGKLVGGGYAAVDNNTIVSTLEVKDGELFANGRKVELPKDNEGDEGDEGEAGEEDEEAGAE